LNSIEILPVNCKLICVPILLELKARFMKAKLKPDLKLYD